MNIFIFTSVLTIFSLIYFIASIYSIIKDNETLFHKRLLLICGLSFFVLIISTWVYSVLVYSLDLQLKYAQKAQKFELVNEQLYRKK
jgi:ABC-type Na+ efflux pump permease subunit